MFLPDVAIDLLPFTKALFDINFSIGYATFYPVLQLLIYIVFVAVCTLLFLAIILVYKTKDAIAQNAQNKVVLQKQTEIQTAQSEITIENDVNNDNKQ